VNSLRSITFWTVIALLWLSSVPNLSGAATDEICPICGDRMGLNIYRFTKRGSDEKVLVCENCAKLETACFICGLPVKHKFMRLADGRLLCNDDAKTAILQQDDTDKIFDDVKRDLQSMLAQLGSLPHHNINVVLEAKARLDKSGANLISAHDDRLLMGLTRTSSREAGKFEHEIHLLYGLTRERMMVVAAHEYAHTWLHENVRRKLNQDTVEGFCDWIAYKMISQKNSPYEMKVLLDSDYSRGQLQAFIAAEKEHSFYYVMQWVKHGVDPEVDAEHLERILALRENSPGKPSADSASTPFAFAPTVPRSAPTNLVLKGLSGSKSRRFALINDATLQANEQGKVRLGDSNVVVHCLQILDDAAVIKVAGENQTRTLKLSAPR
jgi:hypothetical protein